jgi:hypothetical protein
MDTIRTDHVREALARCNELRADAIRVSLELTDEGLVLDAVAGGSAARCIVSYGELSLSNANPILPWVEKIAHELA